MSEQIYKRDSIFGQAMEIGITEMAGFSWRDIDYMLEKMQSITPDQFQAVAKQYLVGGYDNCSARSTSSPIKYQEG
ncbi:hypothetical protein [Polynucleobacter necessarius]|uniref:hypothetical protein n=1 Tax=Polynucleobacter necessarius TaxID=576610 RepID=UPI001E4A5E49|nr:hypothetical protein [Polynucleobacter necessarius]